MLGANNTIPVPEAGEGQSVRLLGIQIDQANSTGPIVYVSYVNSASSSAFDEIQLIASGYVNQAIPIVLRSGTREINAQVFAVAANVLFLFNVS